MQLIKHFILVRAYSVDCRQRTVELLDEKYVKVAEFLNRKGSNSSQTKRVYGFALSHFQTFLPSEFGNKHNVETILAPLEKRADRRLWTAR